MVTTESIRQYIVNDPVMIQPKTQQKKSTGSSWKPKFLKSSTVASTAIQKPISKMDGKKSKSTNEIFVDIFEKLTVLFSANGAMINASIDGVI